MRASTLGVYSGNTADSTTLPEQVNKLKERFALQRVVLVGDRGMLTQTQIDALRQRLGLAGFRRYAPRKFAS